MMYRGKKWYSLHVAGGINAHKKWYSTNGKKWYSSAGSLYTYGWSKYGQLGHGDFNDCRIPHRVEALEDIYLSQKVLPCHALYHFQRLVILQAHLIFLLVLEFWHSILIPLVCIEPQLLISEREKLKRVASDRMLDDRSVGFPMFKTGPGISFMPMQTSTKKAVSALGLDEQNVQYRSTSTDGDKNEGFPTFCMGLGKSVTVRQSSIRKAACLLDEDSSKKWDFVKHFRENLHRRLLNPDFKKQVDGLDMLQKVLQW